MCLQIKKSSSSPTSPTHPRRKLVISLRPLEGKRADPRKIPMGNIIPKSAVWGLCRVNVVKDPSIRSGSKRPETQGSPGHLKPPESLRDPKGSMPSATTRGLVTRRHEWKEVPTRTPRHQAHRNRQDAKGAAGGLRDAGTSPVQSKPYSTSNIACGEGRLISSPLPR